jgi:hypothetical protein
MELTGYELIDIQPLHLQNFNLKIVINVNPNVKPRDDRRIKKIYFFHLLPHVLCL